MARFTSDVERRLPVDTEEALSRLRRNKGISSFETESVSVDKQLITNSTPIIGFMLEVVPTAEPEASLRKQQVIVDEKPTVAGLVLFAEEPQAALPKRCSLKIYRYKTKDDEGTRATLDFDPISVERLRLRPDKGCGAKNSRDYRVSENKHAERLGVHRLSGNCTSRDHHECRNPSRLQRRRRYAYSDF